jgi:prolyl-tRNA editing enzyme YbaK/EbsC (Cys-tRNA(Pro) deacylase)
LIYNKSNNGQLVKFLFLVTTVILNVEAVLLAIIFKGDHRITNPAKFGKKKSIMVSEKFVVNIIGCSR